MRNFITLTAVIFLAYGFPSTSHGNGDVQLAQSSPHGFGGKDSGSDLVKGEYPPPAVSFDDFMDAIDSALDDSDGSDSNDNGDADGGAAD